MLEAFLSQNVFLYMLCSAFEEDLTPLLQGSGKLAVLDHLLQNHKNTGHRTVIFSQSKKMLDIIQAVIQVRRYRFLRLDGDVTKSKDRQRMINKFNQDKSYFCFLITTQAGGVGITLSNLIPVNIFVAFCNLSWSRSSYNLCDFY